MTPAVRLGASRDAQTISAQPDLAAQHAAGALILAGRGNPWRLTFASAAAAEAFRASTLAALAGILTSPEQPGGRRLTELAQTMVAGRSPRMERLRFFVDGRELLLDLQCRMIAGPRGDGLFIASGFGPRSPRGTGKSDLFESEDDAEIAAPTEVGLDGPRLGGAVRFIWEIASDGTLTRLSPEFASAVGARNSIEPGALFGHRASALGVRGHQRLLETVAEGETFAGVEVHWPIGDGRMQLPIAFAGQPMFDKARHIAGYRGFGLIRFDRMFERSPQSAPMIADRSQEFGGPRVEKHPPSIASDVGTSQTNAEIGPDVSSTIATGPGADVRPEAAVPPIGRGGDPSKPPALSTSENDAFDELATLLQARLVGETSETRYGVDVEQGHVAVEPRGAETSPRVVPEPQSDLAVLLDRLPTGVLVARGGQTLYANRTLLELLGYQDLDAFRRAGGLDRILHEPDRAREPDHVGSVALATADGGILEVDGNLKSVMWAGEPATLLAVRRSLEAEIGHRLGPLRAELTARERETAELEATLDTATDGVAVLDAAGLIVSLNRSGEALFGVELSDVVREHFTMLLSPESHATAREYLDGLKKNGVASLLNDGREVVGRAGMRGIIPLFMTIGALRHEGEPRFCVVLRDLTPWKRAERDLQDARNAAERASQLKSDFLARVSHEVRTPLNAILGFCEVMMEERFGAIGNERYKEYLRDIHASGVHVMNIVNDLLDLSKIEAGKMELTFASVDANKVVADCVSLMQPQAYRERVVIRMALSPRLPNIVADDRSLRQIILNILSNAVNFNEPGGQVIVSTALTDTGAAVLRVRDTGVGMNEGDIEAALEPFRQLSTARKGTGTGLGLPLTKALADANRAAFTIKSKKNEGTLVEIAFPPARVLSR